MNQKNLEMYRNFTEKFKQLVKSNRPLVVNTLSNIFTMRLIGNKTHGDLAEIGISEFINQFMCDFESQHVGKDLYRAKEKEEDILIISKQTKDEFTVSLKAYGDGPLQLSTDKNQGMFSYLIEQGTDITDKNKIDSILSSPAFSDFSNVNVLPLIYNETKKQCNIMVFDYIKAIKNTKRILFIGNGESFLSKRSGKSRLHPIFLFLDEREQYICEVRYGGPSANALQRGLWTNTKRALSYFDSLTDGWLDYGHNLTLVRLFSLALNSSEDSHREVNGILQRDIDKLKGI